MTNQARQDSESQQKEEIGVEQHKPLLNTFGSLRDGKAIEVNPSDRANHQESGDGCKHIVLAPLQPA